MATDRKVKLTELEKRMVAKMQARGKLIRRDLPSWEKRSADRLTKKGVFEELPSDQEFFRLYAMNPSYHAGT